MRTLIRYKHLYPFLTNKMCVNGIEQLMFVTTKLTVSIWFEFSTYGKTLMLIFQLSSLIANKIE